MSAVSAIFDRLETLEEELSGEMARFSRRASFEFSTATGEIRLLVGCHMSAIRAGMAAL
jgi:hypothetical protein